MSKRSVAIVSPATPGNGGVATVASWLRQSLADSGAYDVDMHTLATSSSDPYSRQVRKARTWRTPTGPNLDAASGSVHWGSNASEIEILRYSKRRELTNALRGYDLIQVVAGAPSWALPVLSAGPPVVLQVATLVSWERASKTPTDSGPVRFWRNAMTAATSRLETLALRRVDAVMVENAEMFNHVRSVGQPSVYKAPPGIDTSTYCPDEHWNRDGYLLSVCRLGDPRKGLLRMISAYAELADRAPKAPPLVLAGVGPVPPQLQAAVRTFDLEHKITWRPDVSATELPALYRNASIFIQTSYEEGLGLSVIEAMASGIPVVATRTAGTQESVLDGVTGWLVNQGSELQVSSDVADRTLQILSRSESDHMAQRSRERALVCFSSRATAQRFLSVYDKLLVPKIGVTYPDVRRLN